MKLPQEFLQSLQGLTGFEEEEFVQVHNEAKPPVSIRINKEKLSARGELTIGDANLGFAIHDLKDVPWCDTGFYLPKRPSFTFDPSFHAGCYYVQEASSMFLEQAIKQLSDLSKPLKVLDLCAAPGGKSTHIQSLISADSLLVSNEVIKPRSIVLTDNIIRWGCKNVFVTNNDPKAFQKLTAFFDVMVVDAPCSGSGLFRKDEEAISEWSLNNVELCSRRQQRILAEALPALKEGGLLIYSTCSYSKEEDEEIMDWLVNEMDMENLPLDAEAFNGVITTASSSGAKGFRFYPDKIQGEGFFLSCFRKKSEDVPGKVRPSKAEAISAKEKAVIKDWVDDEGLEFNRFRNEIVAVPSSLLTDFLSLQSTLNVVYPGVAMGQVLKDKLIPNHALAQSSLLRPQIPAVELNYDDAIKYLQRQDLHIASENMGWQVVKYKSHSLGWVNVLKNRTNNYYPKEIRILKAHNNTAFEK